ncbi:hypothetical protein LTS18_000384, partial [Coniosporium uncinatum]
RHARRWPFNSLKKRLASLKQAHSTPKVSEKKTRSQSPSKTKKNSNVKNNPYPESGHLHRTPAGSSTNGCSSYSARDSTRPASYTSYEDDSSVRNRPMLSNKSAAPTLATNPETIHSDTGHSKAGTSNTVGGGSRDGGGNSTFSSPNHSDHSLTTTLTTIHSAAPSGVLNAANNNNLNNNNNQTSATANNHLSQPAHFSHQYPTSPNPASAIPSHLQPHPHTYNTATANNLLTDDASILTLASSSKRRRRHSLDTNASVRALAPSSLFSNSRESLPLSFLSGNVDPTGGIYTSQNRPSVGGLASAERASVYSSSGIIPPLLSSERNSYYANKSGMDGAS